MTTDTGSAPVAGNPADATANAGSPTPAPSAAPAPAATSPEKPDNSAAKFFDGFKDESIKGYVQNKGFEDAEALANSYMNLEKLVGKEKIPMPKDENDVEGWNKVYDALGRPKSAEEYKLPVPEGDTGEFAKTAGKWFHEAGVSQKQAEKIAQAWNSYQAEYAKQIEAQAKAQGDQDMAALKTEWGMAFDEKVQTARQYVKELGMTEQEMAAVESIVGTKRMLSMFSGAGEKLGEAKPHGFESKGGEGKLTPAAAKQRMQELQKDQAWVARYLNGDVAAKQEMERLAMFATPAA